MNEQPIDLKTLNDDQLDGVFLQISMQNKLNDKMLEVILTEILERKNKPKHTPMVLPKLNRPEAVIGTFTPPN